MLALCADPVLFTSFLQSLIAVLYEVFSHMVNHTHTLDM